MKVIFGLLATIIMLASCKDNKQEAMLSPDELARQDSMALHIAVMPTMGCLPVYYAQKMGMLDSLTFRVLRYTAQMDVDTAITNHRTDVAYTDLIRAIRLSDSPCPVAVFMSTDEPISLISMKGKRVKKLLQMKEKMIAISRLCVTDYWCDQMMESAKLENDQIYRPQINNVRLRAEMIRNGLLEGAMMAEPYATWMEMLGNKRLYHTGKADVKLAAWVIADSLKKDTSRMRQMRQFAKIYKDAAERINKGEAMDSVRSILEQEYGLPKEIADTLQLNNIAVTLAPETAAVDAALNFLKKRNKTPKKFDMQQFIIKNE